MDELDKANFDNVVVSKEFFMDTLGRIDDLKTDVKKVRNNKATCTKIALFILAVIIISIIISLASLTIKIDKLEEHHMTPAHNVEVEETKEQE